MRTLFWNSQKNNINNNEARRAGELYDESSETFEEACKDLARALMLRTSRRTYYSLGDFIDYYLPKVKSGQYTVRRAMEKYILDQVYGKGVMNAKFNLKYNGSAANKLARLTAIRNHINNPGSNFNWSNVNDPDYYDLSAAENRTNIDWYTNSLNGRIANYRRKAKL